MLAPRWVFKLFYLVQPARFTDKSTCCREQTVPYFGKGAQWTVTTAGIYIYLQMKVVGAAHQRSGMEKPRRREKT